MEGLEISSAYDTWVKIKDSIKDSAKEKVGVLETNRNKPWFDEECSEFANLLYYSSIYAYSVFLLTKKISYYCQTLFKQINN